MTVQLTHFKQQDFLPKLKHFLLPKVKEVLL